MSSIRSKATLALLAIVGLLFAATAAHAAGPVKQVIVSHIGKEVDKTTKGNICTVASGDECQTGVSGIEPGQFKFAKSVAGGPAPADDVYVADNANERVQELTAAGKFVLMFGKHVNATTGGDLCTEVEVEKGAKCQKGEPGAEAGALSGPSSVAVDPSSGDVYVAEPENGRVDEYTAGGEFVLMIGKEVNATTKANVCTEEEIKNVSGLKCQAGAPTAAGTKPEHGAFVEPSVVAEGPNDTLYVGDEHSVQEFDDEGKWLAEIREPLEKVSSELYSRVSRLAVDASGDVFLVYEATFETRTILEFNAAGEEIGEFTAPNSEVAFGIIAIAVDPAGRLAVIENEAGRRRGLLYQIETGTKSLRLITEFSTGEEQGIGFNGADDLYGAALGEIVAYEHVAVGELTVEQAKCVPGAEQETDVTLECELRGGVDPWGVKETEAWFEWGRTPALGERTTPNTKVPASLSEGEEEPLSLVQAPIVGVRPHETFYDEVVGEDEHVKAPERLTSPLGSFTTPSVPPRIVGEPQAYFANSTSADMFAEINPENTNTGYEFEYAETSACPSLENCASANRTKTLQSSEYGKIGTMQEARNLQPATEYRFRLVAENQANQEAVNQAGQPTLPEGTFKTAPTPVPAVRTGPVGSVGQTTATIAGTVEPNGQATSYSFQVGIYTGPETQYGTVHSGSAGAGNTPVEEALALSSLQPGTTYAYRLIIKSGYIENETHTLEGAQGTFVTLPLPTNLNAPPAQTMLATPSTAFPPAVSPVVKCKSGYTKAKNGKCTRVKKKAKKVVKKSGKGKKSAHKAQSPRTGSRHMGASG